MDVNGCLVLYFYEALESLPESFGQLAALQNLDGIGCRILKSLPEFFGLLAALQNAELRACEALELLPESSGSW